MPYLTYLYLLSLFTHSSIDNIKINYKSNYNAIYGQQSELKRQLTVEERKPCSATSIRFNLYLCFFRTRHACCIRPGDCFVYTIQETLVCFSLDVSWFILYVNACECACLCFNSRSVCARGRYTKCCCLLWGTVINFLSVELNLTGGRDMLMFLTWHSFRISDNSQFCTNK